MASRTFYMVVEVEEALPYDAPASAGPIGAAVTVQIVDRETLEAKAEYTDSDGDLDYAAQRAVRVALQHGDDLLPREGR